MSSDAPTWELYAASGLIVLVLLVYGRWLLTLQRAKETHGERVARIEGQLSIRPDNGGDRMRHHDLGDPQDWPVAPVEEREFSADEPIEEGPHDHRDPGDRERLAGQEPEWRRDR